jgi:hypothetical protein
MERGDWLVKNFFHGINLFDLSHVNPNVLLLLCYFHSSVKHYFNPSSVHFPPKRYNVTQNKKSAPDSVNIKMIQSIP